jgi:hypothetical protein
MPPISALDAIGPAVRRTRDFLFRPFRLPTFLKLCLVALLTEGFGGNFNLSLPGSHAPGHDHFANTPFAYAPAHIALIAAVALVFTVVCFYLYYLVTRLRFAYFHCLIHNTRQIRPGWRLYRAQAIRFFWLSVAVGFCFLLLVALIALPFVAGFWRLSQHTPPGGHPNIGALLALLLPLFPILFLLILVAVVADLIMRDFMLPHFALDNATSGHAWAAVWTRIRTEKAAFFVYALLRLILPLVAIFAIFLVLVIPTIIIIAAFALIEVGIHSAFAGAGGATPIIAILLEVLIGLVAFGIVFLASLCLGGPLGTAIREYALLFYSGRYERLGAALFPPPDTSLNPPSPA